MEAEAEPRRRTTACARSGITLSKIKKKAKDLEIKLPFGSGRQDEGHRHLHAPVRDHDRRRPAARAVPRHPRRRRRDEQDASARSSATSRRSVEEGATFSDALRKHPKVFDDLYVNLVAGRRGRRHPRHDPAAPRGLHREGVKLKRQVKGAMVYPIVDPRASRIVVVDRAALEGHPGLREHVQGLRRRRAARADAVRHRRLARASSTTCRHHRRRLIGASSSASTLTLTHRAGARWRSTAFMLKLPVIGPCCARSPSRASRARWARCSPPACRSSTRSTSCAKTAGNMVVEDAHHVRAREDLRGQEHGRAAHGDARSSRRWSCR